MQVLWDAEYTLLGAGDVKVERNSKHLVFARIYQIWGHLLHVIFMQFSSFLLSLFLCITGTLLCVPEVLFTGKIPGLIYNKLCSQWIRPAG